MTKKEEKRTVRLDNGAEAPASFPVIVSASRSTDIPAFYSDWFFERLKKGWSAWINPFNGKKYFVSYEDTRFIVFWSKNPRPLLRLIPYLEERGTGFYIQFSLNDYAGSGLEPGLPSLEHRIETFKLLAERLGRGAVIWRFDPLVLTDDIGIDDLLARIHRLGNELHKYSEKLVFSFADILSYASVKARLDRKGIAFRDWTVEQMREFCAKLVELNKAEGWKLRLATCAEQQGFPDIEQNSCIDELLMLRLCKSRELWDFLGAEDRRPPLLQSQSQLPQLPHRRELPLGDGRWVTIKKDNSDKGQRHASGCGCVKSKDIGQYQTCPHLCAYCYANHNEKLVKPNHARHMRNPGAELISS